MGNSHKYSGKTEEGRQHQQNNLNRLGKRNYHLVDEDWRARVMHQIEDRKVGQIGNRFIRAKRPLVGPPTLNNPEYKNNIVKFLNDHFYIETRKPLVIEDWQAKILNDIFHKGKIYKTILLGLPKKEGKSTAFLAGINLWRLLFSERDFGEQYIACNDLEQGKSVVFNKIVRCVELNHRLLAILNVTSDKIELTSKGNFIQVLPQDFAGSSGMSPSLVTFDELWGFQLESARRVYEVLCENPARPDFMTLIASHAGYEKRGLLWELYQAGIDEKNKPKDFYFLWSHENRASWVTKEFLERQKFKPGMRPEIFQRFWKNYWVEGERSFFMEKDYLSCVNRDITPVISDKKLNIWVGVDASVSNDTSCYVAVTKTPEGKIRLIKYQVWKPSKAHRMDLSATIGSSLRTLNRNFKIRIISYDPYQLHSLMTDLKNEGLPCQELAQTQGNTIAFSQLLYELIHYQNIEFYPNQELKEHIMSAEIKESSAGFRIVKGSQKNKVDLAVALGMASYSCVNSKPRKQASVYTGSDDDYDGMDLDSWWDSRYKIPEIKEEEKRDKKQAEVILE
ncbi:hypothetical protein ES705_05354 [subsurface metagenome]